MFCRRQRTTTLNRFRSWTRPSAYKCRLQNVSTRRSIARTYDRREKAMEKALNPHDISPFVDRTIPLGITQQAEQLFTASGILERIVKTSGKHFEDQDKSIIMRMASVLRKSRKELTALKEVWARDNVRAKSRIYYAARKLDSKDLDARESYNIMNALGIAQEKSQDKEKVTFTLKQARSIAWAFAELVKVSEEPEAHASMVWGAWKGLLMAMIDVGAPHTLLTALTPEELASVRRKLEDPNLVKKLDDSEALWEAIKVRWAKQYRIRQSELDKGSLWDEFKKVCFHDLEVATKTLDLEEETGLRRKSLTDPLFGMEIHKGANAVVERRQLQRRQIEMISQVIKHPGSVAESELERPKTAAEISAKLDSWANDTERNDAGFRFINGKPAFSARRGMGQRARIDLPDIDVKERSPEDIAGGMAYDPDNTRREGLDLDEKSPPPPQTTAELPVTNPGAGNPDAQSRIPELDSQTAPRRPVEAESASKTEPKPESKDEVEDLQEDDGVTNRGKQLDRLPSDQSKKQEKKERLTQKLEVKKTKKEMKKAKKAKKESKKARKKARKENEKWAKGKMISKVVGKGAAQRKLDSGSALAKFTSL